MAVIPLADGALWLHSVAHLTPELKAALDALGPVRFAVSPNRFHHFFMEQYAAAYPEISLYASPGLPEKRKDLSFRGVLGDRREEAWAPDLEQMAFRGFRAITEIVFFQRSTRTLILTDLLFQIPSSRPFATRLSARLLGYYAKPGVTGLLRWAIADRAAVRESLARMLAWDFDRVILGHGDMIETGGRAAVVKAFSWLGEA